MKSNVENSSGMSTNTGWLKIAQSTKQSATCGLLCEARTFSKYHFFKYMCVRVLYIYIYIYDIDTRTHIYTMSKFLDEIVHVMKVSNSRIRKIFVTFLWDRLLIRHLKSRKKYLCE